VIELVARLGMVLYWAASAVAGFLAAGTAAVIVMGAFNVWGFESENNVLEAVVFIPAAVIWLFGRACRYVLAGN
jgi:hypothetical protein